MRVGVVISTLGRSQSFSLLLESLFLQTYPSEQIVVVDQGGGDEVTGLVEAWSDRLPITRITTERGVSKGRNAGWRALEDCDVVAFPDDDCTYEPTAFESLVAIFERDNVDAISGRLVGARQRVAFVGTRCEIDRKSVWTKAIEATTFYTMRALSTSGGFSENLGIGAPTKWQSGEGTDLLLRILDKGGKAIFDPAIVVTEHQLDISPESYLLKARAYGRGTGRVYRLRYTPLECVAVVVKPLVGATALAIRGRREEALVKLHAALGRTEGMFGPERR